VSRFLILFDIFDIIHGSEFCLIFLYLYTMLHSLEFRG